MKHRILSINPGSTSTKISVYEDVNEVFKMNINHATEELCKYQSVVDQLDFRKKLILNALNDNGIQIESLSAVVGRGGFVKPIPSGTYEVNERMLEDLNNPTQEHASTLGGIIAHKIAFEAGLKAYIVDPIVVDELQPLARYSGHAEIKRTSIFHALNHKATVRKLAKELGCNNEDENFIVVHMGGGVSVGAHRRGLVVDVNNALTGEGPFSAQRTGGLPLLNVVDMCYSNEYNKAEVQKKLVGLGGLYSYTGTTDCADLENKASMGDEQVKEVLQAMAYQVAKEVGSQAVVLKGEVKAILLTGGIAYSKLITKTIDEMVSFIAPVHIIPGENEMEALSNGVLQVLLGAMESKVYQ